MKQGYQILPQAFVPEDPGPAGLHVLARRPELMKWLERIPRKELDKFFKSPYVLHAFSVLDNREQSFANEIHRDIRFYSGSIPMMCNLIFMIDDFTSVNGATWILPDSHKLKYSPNRSFFSSFAIQVEGKAGDILMFNSNLWHRAGINYTSKPRRCIAMTFSKSALKQLLDYPRALGDIDASAEVKQLLGYDSRVPASIEEWEGERTYKKNQD